MSKASVMGGASTSEVLKAWRSAVAEVTADAKARGLNLSGKDKPLPTSNASLVKNWRAAGAAVEKQLNPKKKQREVLTKLLGSDNIEAAADAVRLLDEMDREEGEDNGQA